VTLSDNYPDVPAQTSHINHIVCRRRSHGFAPGYARIAQYHDPSRALAAMFRRVDGSRNWLSDEGMAIAVPVPRCRSIEAWSIQRVRGKWLSRSDIRFHTTFVHHEVRHCAAGRCVLGIWTNLLFLQELARHHILAGQLRYWCWRFQCTIWPCPPTCFGHISQR